MGSPFSSLLKTIIAYSAILILGQTHRTFTSSKLATTMGRYNTASMGYGRILRLFAFL
jgi:hypothetical protein